MADTIRDVVIRLKLEQLPAEIKAPDITQIVKHIETYEKVVIETTKEIVERNETVQRSVREIADEHQRAATAADDSADKIADAQIKVGDGLAASTEGAFNLAKGFALFAVAGEEDSKKLIESIAKIEGGYQTLKGAFELVKGGTEAMRALRVATQAATVAETARTAAMAASTTATQGATAAAVALNVASGPIGVTVVALTAAVGALGAAYLLLGDNANKANEEAQDGLDRQLEAIMDTNAALARQVELQIKLADIAGEDVSARLSLIDDPAARLAILQSQAAGLAPAGGEFGLQPGDISTAQSQALEASRQQQEVLRKQLEAAEADRIDVPGASGYGHLGPLGALEQMLRGMEESREIKPIRESLAAAQEAELQTKIEIREAVKLGDEQQLEAIKDRIENLQKQKQEIEAIADAELKALEEKRRLVEQAAATKDIAKRDALLGKAGPELDTLGEIDAATRDVLAKRNEESAEIVRTLGALQDMSTSAKNALAMLTDQINALNADMQKVRTRLAPR